MNKNIFYYFYKMSRLSKLDTADSLIKSHKDDTHTINHEDFKLVVYSTLYAPGTTKFENYMHHLSPIMRVWYTRRLRLIISKITLEDFPDKSKLECNWSEKEKFVVESLPSPENGLFLNAEQENELPIFLPETYTYEYFKSELTPNLLKKYNSSIERILKEFPQKTNIGISLYPLSTIKEPIILHGNDLRPGSRKHKMLYLGIEPSQLGFGLTYEEMDEVYKLKLYVPGTLDFEINMSILSLPVRNYYFKLLTRAMSNSKTMYISSERPCLHEDYHDDEACNDCEEYACDSEEELFAEEIFEFSNFLMDYGGLNYLAVNYLLLYLPGTSSYDYIINEIIDDSKYKYISAVDKLLKQYPDQKLTLGKSLYPLDGNGDPIKLDMHDLNSLLSSPVLKQPEVHNVELPGRTSLPVLKQPEVHNVELPGRTSLSSPVLKQPEVHNVELPGRTSLAVLKQPEVDKFGLPGRP
jgi:hypothetical protein